VKLTEFTPRPRFFEKERNKKALLRVAAPHDLAKGLRMDDDHRLPGTVLVDLYVRLRDEVDKGDLDLDPNHKIRSAIVMAILSAAETVADIAAVEAHVRRTLGLHPQPLAA